MAFVICTDSACDLDQKMLASLGVRFAELTFRFDGEDREYSNFEMENKAFYDKMRAGGVARTAAINESSFEALFTEILDTGADILYLGFSTGLSSTYNSARMAATALMEKYPERKIITVDTLAASAGQGLIVYLVCQKRDSGATLEDTSEYAKSVAPRMCHWFTVDDLVYLKRGGRVSAITAIAGNLLGIKPVLHVDDEGHLVNVLKARGRKNSILELAKKYDELALDKSGIAFICQAQCTDDAQLLANMLREKHGADVKYIADIGPVIGAHAGPGTLALFFEGKER